MKVPADEDFAFVRVRRTLPEDGPAVETLRADAESRPELVACGQWQYAGQRWEAGRTKRLERVRSGGMWIVETRSGVPLASFCVDDDVDPEFWGEGERKNALALHGTVVGSWASGLGIGSSIHDFACRLAAADGKRWLRLDAWKTNPALHAIYVNDGFEHVRTVDLPHRLSGVLFQRPSSLVRNIGPAFVVADRAPVNRGQQAGGLLMSMLGR